MAKMDPRSSAELGRSAKVSYCFESFDSRVAAVTRSSTAAVENRLCTSDLRGRGPWHAALDGGGGWVPLSSPLFATRVDISIVSPSAPVGRFVDSISRSTVTLSFSTLISSSLPTCCA